MDYSIRQIITIFLHMQNLREQDAETITTPPKVQKFERILTLEKEHKDALERAVSLNIPHAVTSAEEEPPEEGSSTGKEPREDDTGPEEQTDKSFCKNARNNWNEAVEKLFHKSESGKLLLKRDGSASASGSGSTTGR